MKPQKLILNQPTESKHNFVAYRQKQYCSRWDIYFSEAIRSELTRKNIREALRTSYANSPTQL